MISERIRQLREENGLSQSELARKLDVTRSSVNAWESGLSSPTTQYVVAMTRLFHVSADYLLGTEAEYTLSLRGYSTEEIRLLKDMVAYFDRNRDRDCTAVFGRMYSSDRFGRPIRRNK